MATLSPEQEILQQLLGGGLSLGIIPPPNAHENMDSIIEEEEYSSILGQLMDQVPGESVMRESAVSGSFPRMQEATDKIDLEG